MKSQEIKVILEKIAENWKPKKWRNRFFFQKQFPFFKIERVVDKIEIIDRNLLMEATIDYDNKKIFGYITKIEWAKNKITKN